MSTIDIIIYTSIALLYNLLAHNIASLSYKEFQFNDKYQNTIIMLILFGGIGIVISKFLKNRNKHYKKAYVSTGLYYGGILLILTGIFANWHYMEDEIKLFGIIGIFGFLIWYSQKRDINLIKNEQKV